MTDLTGQVFGRLTVIERLAKQADGSRSPLWLCRCSCGTERQLSTRSLKSGNTKSCGCLRREASRERLVAYNAVRDANL